MKEQNKISPSNAEISPATGAQKADHEILHHENKLQLPGGFVVQKKLHIGAYDDPAEHESDAIADKIMRMPDMNFVRRKCAHCEEEENKIRRKGTSSFIQKKDSGTVAADSITSQVGIANGGGSSMDNNTRSFMETRFGADFSAVKIHTSTGSAQLSRKLNARAFTVGNDIHFSEGKYDPFSAEGKHLLAHELTHTIQNGGSADIIQRDSVPDRMEAEKNPVVLNESAQQAVRERLLAPLRKFDSAGFMVALKNVTMEEADSLLKDTLFFEELKKYFRGASLWIVYIRLYYQNDAPAAERRLSMAISDKNINMAKDALAVIIADDDLQRPAYWDTLGQVIYDVFGTDPAYPELVNLLKSRKGGISQPKRLNFSTTGVKYKAGPDGTYQLESTTTGSSMVVYANRTEFRIQVRIRFVDGNNPQRPYYFLAPGEQEIPAKWKTGIENSWNNKFELQNVRQSLRVVVVPVFIFGTGSADRTVRILTDKKQICDGSSFPGQANDSCWFTGSGVDTIAHEFGHLLGAVDEYMLPETAAEIPEGLKNGLTPEELKNTTKEGINEPGIAVPGKGYTIFGLMGGHAGGNLSVKARHISRLVQEYNNALPEGTPPYQIKEL